MIYPCVLTIAGSDSSGGAGIQADIKTITTLGSYAASVITALTAQNTQGVQAIKEIDPQFVKEQLDSVFSDLNVVAVKIGMVHNKQIVDEISPALNQYKPQFIVQDPVMVAQSGDSLIEESTIEYIKQKLFSKVTLITPNIPEAEKLLKIKINDTFEMETAAKKLGLQYKVNVLVKGGHLHSEKSSDILYIFESDSVHWFHSQRIDTRNNHGTGCTLSSAIACYLALGYSMFDAIKYAKNYLTQAMKEGSLLRIGHGHGPVKHNIRNVIPSPAVIEN